MAENILAAACDSETRNAAKRMRLDVYQATVNVSEAYINFVPQGLGNVLGRPRIIDAKLPRHKPEHSAPTENVSRLTGRAGLC